MKCEDIRCRKCGENAMEACEHGAYLERVSPKGKKPIEMECRPACNVYSGTPSDALIGAVGGGE